MIQTTQKVVQIDLNCIVDRFSVYLLSIRLFASTILAQLIYMQLETSF